ncbi:OmpA family protein [Alistipes sp. OttesenSCG-928-B03]|nr:OmpA family protein [Alistipes sp. OttesenSCG-928-B03]
MANLLQTIKSQFTPEVISKIGSYLGESDAQVSSGVNKAVPAILAGLLEKGKTAAIDNIFGEARSSGVVESLGDIFAGKGDEKLRTGEKLIEAALGHKETALASDLSENNLMSNLNAKKFLSVIGTFIAGHFGRHSGAWDELSADKNAILAALPAGFGGLFNIKAEPTVKKEEPRPAAKKEEPKKKSKWWLWLLIVLLLLLLLLWALRSCKSCNRVTEVEEITAIVPIVNDTKPQPAGEVCDFALPDGTVVTACPGGIEDKMIAFLNSDTYKNGDDAELKKHWFEFDRIDFKYDSATELMEGSKAQIDNLIAILRYYGNAKIRIGGFADHKGSEGVNMAISQQRANTIKKMFAEGGIDAARVSTEGFGEEYATVPATATDAERAPDRDIALRFTK